LILSYIKAPVLNLVSYPFISAFHFSVCHIPTIHGFNRTNSADGDTFVQSDDVEEPPKKKKKHANAKKEAAPKKKATLKK